MQKDVIRVNAPYVLEVGQGLLDQEPFSAQIPKTSEALGIEPKNLQILLIKSSTLIDGPRLPYYDPSDPSNTAITRYQSLEDSFSKDGENGFFINDPEVRKVYMAALESIGRDLILFPNWLRYLEISKADYGIAYDDDGSWIPRVEIKNQSRRKKGQEKQFNVLSRMDAAPSYGYWAYLQQVKNGLIPATFMDEREVTGLLQRNKFTRMTESYGKIEELTPIELEARKGILGPQEWILKAAPRDPISLVRPFETSYAYKARLLTATDNLENKSLNI